MADQQDDPLALQRDSGERAVDLAFARATEALHRFDNIVLNIGMTGSVVLLSECAQRCEMRKEPQKLGIQKPPWTAPYTHTQLCQM